MDLTILGACFIKWDEIKGVLTFSAQPRKTFSHIFKQKGLKKWATREPNDSTPIFLKIDLWNDKQFLSQDNTFFLFLTGNETVTPKMENVIG